jgi:protein subunit release factor A
MAIEREGGGAGQYIELDKSAVVITHRPAFP